LRFINHGSMTSRPLTRSAALRGPRRERTDDDVAPPFFAATFFAATFFVDTFFVNPVFAAPFFAAAFFATAFFADVFFADAFFTDVLAPDDLVADAFDTAFFRGATRFATDVFAPRERDDDIRRVMTPPRRDHRASR
jgi:hypothetical protein